MSLANRFLNWVLRSPLHILFSKNFMLITIKGQKTGKRYTFPVAYARVEEQVIILVGNSEKKTWWRNLLGGAPVELLISGEALQGQAQVLQRGKPAVQGLLVALEAYCWKFPATARSRGIYASASGNLKPSQLMHAVQSEVIVFIDLDH